jgi:hypothetical protein
VEGAEWGTTKREKAPTVLSKMQKNLSKKQKAGGLRREFAEK